MSGPSSRPSRQWPPPPRGSRPVAGDARPQVDEPEIEAEAEADLVAAGASAGPPEAAPPTDQPPADPGPPAAPTPSGADRLAGVTAERDDYLDRLRRLQADFENYKKRVVKQQLDHRERAAEDLLTQLLPVLDNFDLGLAHGTEGLEPVHRSLLEVLANVGLERLDPAGQPFDPNEHNAVLHEAADGGGEPEVLEVLRAGYRWKGRVLRPAMVKVKG